MAGQPAPVGPHLADAASASHAEEPIVRLRHPGRWVAAVVLVVLAAMFVNFVVTTQQLRLDLVMGYLFERSIMRLWVYNSEELAHWNVNVCSHNLRHAKRMDQRYTHEQQIAAAEKCPNPMIALRLKRRLAVGVSAEEENEAYEKLDYLLDQMEERLQHGPWIAGQSFTLADVAMAPMVNRIEVLARPEMIAASKRPRVADWWQRIQARPGYQTAFSF